MTTPARVVWSRPEPFGAWVRLDDATLIAVDHALAARLGVPSGAPSGERAQLNASSAPSAAPLDARPLELHIAVTSRCFAPCDGCYMDARPDGDEPPLDQIVARLAAARDAGASTIALGGGEPLLRPDLGAIAEAARALGLVPVMTTSGIGLTEARARELVAFAQVNVSHDGALGAYRGVRGFDGEAAAERAIALLHGAGVPVGANVTLTRSTFEALPATAARVASLGAREIQLLRYKPGGRAASASYAERRLSPPQIAQLWPMIQGLVARGDLGVRIDCSMVPLLSTDLTLMGPRAAQALSQLGVFGCEAARHLAGMRVDGTLSPCSFFSIPQEPPRPARSLPVISPPTDSFSGGSDQRERRGEAPALPSARSEAPALPSARSEAPALPSARSEAPYWQPALPAFRAYHADLPEPCRSCELASVCRGGCQVVSRYASGGAFAPDPECPRVIAFRSAEPDAPPPR